MSIGLGKRYFVQIVDSFYGNLEECIEFMKKHLEISYCWFELHPEVQVIKGVAHCTGFYRCDYVKDGH